MKKTILIIALLLATVAQGQQRDRRVDLTISCGYRIDLSTTGRLWIGTRCGDIFTADSIGATWRTAIKDEDPMHIGGASLERIAAFGDDIAVAAGYMDGEGYVLRTTTGGAVWDTVQVDTNLVWVHGFCYHADGRMWMAAASGRQYECMAYSTDRGQSFTTLMPPFADPNDDEGGVEELYMVTADSGFAGTYGGSIYSTSDNWRTAHQWANPIEQGLMEKDIYSDSWVNRIRPWRGWLIATLSQSTFCTPMGSSPKWQTLPWATYEVDTVSGNLWVISDSGQLLYLTDMNHHRLVLDRVDGSIIGTLGGSIYLRTLKGVVRVSPDGRTDTCGFYTEEKTISEMFDEKTAKYGKYAAEYLPTFSHGGRLWRTDGTSIYLQDALGWYRVAKPLGIREMHADPDREDRVVILRGDGMNYSVDTAGHIEPYTYRQPMTRFLESGLQSVEITTYYTGCFHHEDHTIAYTRDGDRLRETKNTIDSNRWVSRHFPADTLERALMRLGKAYSLFPTPADFGLQEGDVNLEKALLYEPYGCTSGAGYNILFINGKGDTLQAYGSSYKECGDYFPWMLPMRFTGSHMAFVTYQPLLWQTLRPMMPEGMRLRGFLSNSSLVDLRPGDLLFFSEEGAMGNAIKASTGQYTHVAMVESLGYRDTVWIIDATQKHGVSRRPLTIKYGSSDFPDVYRFKYGCFSIDSVLARARSFIGQPYDNAFLPDNGALYCSELVYEVFLDDCSDKGKHLIEAKPMNWRDKNGNLPKYWKKHFKKLGMPVPEGVPGTNPTDLSRSPMLNKVL
jgi:cell wall-associated NlpC family hydrolase